MNNFKNHKIIIFFIIIVFFSIFLSLYFKKDTDKNIEKNNKLTLTGSKDLGINITDTSSGEEFKGNISYENKEGKSIYFTGKLDTYDNLVEYFQKPENSKDIEVWYKEFRVNGHNSLSSGVLALEYLYECNSLKNTTKDNLLFLKEFINSYIEEIIENEKFKNFYLENEKLYNSDTKEKFGYSYNSIFNFLNDNQKESLEKMEYALLSFLFFKEKKIKKEEFNSNIEKVIKNIVDPDEEFFLFTLKGIVNNFNFDCFKEGEAHYNF